MLERGELDLGLVTGEVLHVALAGIGGPPSRVKVLSAMYSQPGMFVMRADSRPRSIAELRGKAGRVRSAGLVPGRPRALRAGGHRVRPRSRFRGHLPGQSR